MEEEESRLEKRNVMRLRKIKKEMLGQASQAAHNQLDTGQDIKNKEDKKAPIKNVD